MASVFVSLALGISGAIALWGLYRALELNWPEQYVSLNDTFALRVTQTWWRFLVYRFVPLFAAGIAIWATTERVGGVPVLAVCAMSVIHVGHTNVLALFESFGKLQRHRKFTINYAAYHILIIFIISVATLAACIFGSSLAYLVPAPHILLENLWIAIFIAIASGIAIAVIGRRPSDANGFDSDYFVWRAKRDVDIELIDWAFDQAVKSRSDPILLRSIMFAEALQRPGWIRSLEQAKGLIFKKGSYGVTQEHSEIPISDRESISRTAKRLAHSWAIRPEEYGFAAEDSLVWKFASRHNADIAFIQGVQKIYKIVAHDYSTIPGISSRNIHLIEVRRYSDEFGLRGISVASELHFHYQPLTGDPETSSLYRPIDVEVDEPWSFECRVPVDTVSMNLDLFRNGYLENLEIPIMAASL